MGWAIFKAMFGPLGVSLGVLGVQSRRPSESKSKNQAPNGAARRAGQEGWGNGGGRLHLLPLGWPKLYEVTT